MKRYILPLLLCIFCANATVVAPEQKGVYEPSSVSVTSVPAFDDAEAYADMDAGQYVRYMQSTAHMVYVRPETRKAADILARTYDAAGKIGAANLALWAEIAGKRTNLSPRLLLSVGCHESSCNPKRRSRKGAHGFMQIMGSVWGDSRRELEDYRYSLVRGAEILAYYRDSICHGNLKCALQVYNVGEGNYTSGMRNKRYVNSVASILRSVGGRI